MPKGYVQIWIYKRGQKLDRIYVYDINLRPNILKNKRGRISGVAIKVAGFPATNLVN